MVKLTSACCSVEGVELTVDNVDTAFFPYEHLNEGTVQPSTAVPSREPSMEYIEFTEVYVRKLSAEERRQYQLLYRKVDHKRQKPCYFRRNTLLNSVKEEVMK